MSSKSFWMSIDEEEEDEFFDAQSNFSDEETSVNLGPYELHRAAFDGDAERWVRRCTRIDLRDDAC